jgi:leucyl-tRNA synthetase
MVLNHIFSRRTRQGRHRVLRAEESRGHARREAAIAGATLKADGKPVDYDGIGTMSKSKTQRRRPAGPHRQVRRRHARAST